MKERDNTYKISVRDKDYNPANNTSFSTQEINKSDLRDIVKRNNYSLITWEGGDRREEKFKSASGIIVDVDDGLTIKKAIARLKKHGLNYFIVTSKSHTKEDNKYHMLIFFSHTVYNLHAYKEIGDKLLELFPEADPSFRDGARFIFGSPKDCEIYEELNGSSYDVSEVKGLWDQGTVLNDKDGNKVELSEKMIKTPIICPFHNDTEPSAFVAYSGENYFISCSACNKTFWMYENKDAFYARKFKNYFVIGDNIWQCSAEGDEFVYEKVGRNLFHAKTGTDTNIEIRRESYNYLANNKHILKVKRVNHISDINASTSYYEIDMIKREFTVHYTAIPSNIEDNDFIEQYLEDRFGEYKSFIKEWLAVYCYTDYKKLPTLIFKGPRGSGKTSFAEIIAEIYLNLSIQWSGNQDSFTYEAEKKLLIVEENDENKLSQYKALKKYSGIKNFDVNKKFKDVYKVRNNMNICILSNEVIPVFVRSEEMPTNTKNNQFFVYDFPELSDDIDPEIQKKIIARLGYYIRTELKTVFDALDLEGYRYSIDVPITEYEKALFENNTTEIEQEVDEFVSELQDARDDILNTYYGYAEFLKKGRIPVKLIKEFKEYNHHKLVKAMIRMKYITGKAEKFQVGGSRHHCYKMTDDLIKKMDTVS